MPTIDIDRDAAHEAAQSELEKPIYPRASLTERLTDWLDELLYRIVAEGASVPGGWFTISVLLILLAIAVVAGVRVARRTTRTRRGIHDRLFGETELSADQHRANAEKSAAEGNWAAAIRHRLRAVARQLEETSVLNPVPGRTATELARDAGAALPHVASGLLNAAAAFNDVTYGERPGSEASYRMVADLDHRLRIQAASKVGSDAAPVAGGDGWADVR